ncbi:MAG TPA: hypothetical protein VKU84_13155, partial [Stellaceae bacterium]|nr:hypothetical protein [Stellaceae bacterium]
MIYSYSKRIPRCKPLNAASFHRDGLTEKAIEDLLASNPGLLFSNPEDVLLVGRQRHGSRLPDLLFLDGARNLYVVEIKRDSADRTCVAQVQEYGARLGDWTREDFENLWKGLHRKTPLAKGLRDHLGFGLTEPIARNVKLVIVAQSPGPGIADLIDWLHENGLSIHFVPFALYRLGERRFFEMTPIRASRAARAASSNWYLNTNETFRQGSSQDMFHQGIAALAGFGPKDGRKMLAEPGPGARV